MRTGKNRNPAEMPGGDYQRQYLPLAPDPSPDSSPELSQFRCCAVVDGKPCPDTPTGVVLYRSGAHLLCKKHQSRDPKTGIRVRFVLDPLPLPVEEIPCALANQIEWGLHENLRKHEHRIEEKQKALEYHRNHIETAERLIAESEMWLAVTSEAIERLAKREK